MSKKLKNIRLDAENSSLIVEKRVAKKQRQKHEKTKSQPDENGQNFDSAPVKKGYPILSFQYTRRMRNLSYRHGKTVFFVSGKNGARMLRALSKTCSVKNVCISDAGVQFEVESKHRNQIIAILNNLCYDYKIIRNKGAMPFAINAFARVGLVLGIIVAIAAVGIFSQLVTRVSVYTVGGADETIDGALNAQIQDILTSHGISRGSWLTKLDIDGAYRSLLALNGVSYADVRRRGTHVDVQIKKEQRSDHYVDVSGSTVTARKTAVVTRVIVEGGTAVVDYGDIVHAGDILIDGYTVFGEDKLDVEAKGIVYGKVYHKKTVFFADNETVKTVGDVKRVTKLSMFGKTPKAPESPFEKYETASTVQDLGFLLPFKIYTYEFRQIVETESINTLTPDEMYARVYSEIIAGFDEPMRVLNRYEECKVADGGRYITVTVEAEERIS